MKEITNNKGIVTKIFAKTIEDEALSQITNLCNNEAYSNNKIRIMPDCHAGKGCTIGTTIQLTDKITPNLVGVDINCGMLVCKIAEKNINFEKLDGIINRYIPSGFNIHEKALADFNLRKLKCYSIVDNDMALRSIGSLGGGNHFIEIDKDDECNNYLVVHSGSRNLGVRICKYYQELAISKLSDNSSLVKGIIQRLKNENRANEISSELSKLPKNKVDKDLAYVEGNDFDDYIHDMKIIQNYAHENRKMIADIIREHMGFTYTDHFETLHNYIDIDNMILRKGAVSAQKGEKLIIPMNMRDGSLICIGKGNEDWNYSAPHGAGRLMSRSKAKENIRIDEFKESMNGIYSTSVCDSTIDESPMAYKPMGEIIECIKDTVDIMKIIKPVYNFKAS